MWGYEVGISENPPPPAVAIIYQLLKHFGLQSGIFDVQGGGSMYIKVFSMGYHKM